MTGESSRISLCRRSADEPLTVYGDGSQTRSFCYVDDLVTGMLALLGSSYTGPVNIGSDEERSVLEVAQLVLEVSGSRSGIVFRDRPVDDPSQRRPDLTLARRQLHWEPTTGMAEGWPAPSSGFGRGSPGEPQPGRSRRPR